MDENIFACDAKKFASVSFLHSKLNSSSPEVRGTHQKARGGYDDAK
jgi:hypothetical protein